MSALRYPELVLTIHSDLRPDEIATRIGAIESAIAVASGDDETGGLTAHQELLSIEQSLAIAHSLFQTRKYEDAIRAYKAVLGKILEYLSPSISSVASLALVEGRDSRDVDLTDQVAMVAANFLSALLPARPQVDFATLAPLPKTLEATVRKYDTYGVRGVDDLPILARAAADLGFGYSQKGEYAKAIIAFERALRQSDSGVHQAALLLNLGAAQLQMGKMEEAFQRLEMARKLYTDQKDRLGLAQVHQNLGILFRATGNVEKATGSFKRAKELLDELGGSDGALNNDAALPSREKPPFASSTKSALSIQLGKANLTTLRVLGGPTHVTFRQPGAEGGWAVARALTNTERQIKSSPRSVGFVRDNEIITVSLATDVGRTGRELLERIYQPRVEATNVNHLVWAGKEESDFAAQLPHLAHFVIPLALGDSFSKLGRFELAETYYLQAANYKFLNKTIEAATLWQRLAENYGAWGDERYKAEEIADALDKYTRVITQEDKVPAGSPLFTLPNLRAVATKARAFYQDFKSASLNPAIRSATLRIRARIRQISAGLNFFGVSPVPIFTFKYLQSVARLFAQRAIEAERDFVRFTVSAENGEATRRQLEQTVERAHDQVELERERRNLARLQELAAIAAEQASRTARENAEEARELYEQNLEFTQELDTILAGLNAPTSGPGAAGGRPSSPLLPMFIEQARIRRDREMLDLANMAEQAQAAETAAATERLAAEAQVEVAERMVQAAQTTLEQSQENLVAFDNQLFTPELWNRMAALIRFISDQYLNAAIWIALMMEKAYNFENDSKLRIISEQYAAQRASLESVTDGMLAGDALLAKVESFTFLNIVTARSKPVRLKQTISLSEYYPFLFYRFKFGSDDPNSVLRKGLMRFQTRLEQFDREYPGSYGQRLKAVEIVVDGILPPAGVHGKLTNGGFSRYWTLERDEKDDFVQKARLQRSETLLLSDYRIVNDSLVFRDDGTMSGIFEGAGVTSSWELELAPRSNDLNHALISDVRMTLYYEAFYDSELDQWIRRRPVSPEELQRNISFLLRPRFPDQYFAFQENGALEWQLSDIDFPFNQLHPRIRHAALQLVWEDGAARAVSLNFATPVRATGVDVRTDARGRLLSEESGPLAPVASGPAVGPYALRIDRTQLAQAELLKIRDVILFLSYEYALP